MSNQNVVDGGVDTGGAYGGVIDYVANIDGHKLGLWKGLVGNIHVSTQVGSFDRFIGKAGAIALASTPLLYPLPGDQRTEITGWTVGQFLRKDVLAFAGKLNSIDLQTGFFPHLDFGRTGFANTNLFAPALPWFRFIELSMIGGGIEKLDPRGVKYGVLAFDAQNSSTTSGFDNLFDDVVGLAFYKWYIDIGDKPGDITVAFGGSSKSYAQLEPASWVIGSTPDTELVIPGFRGEKEDGAWAVTAYYNQILWQADPKGGRNIRLFTGIGGGPNDPGISNFSFFGTLEATGYFASRPRDKFGIGGYYNSIADNLTESAALLRNPLDDDTSGIELYYNAELTPWLRLTGNVQFINSASPGADTSIVPGVRLGTAF